jgi:hypothetical protein
MHMMAHSEKAEHAASSVFPAIAMAIAQHPKLKF